MLAGRSSGPRLPLLDSFGQAEGPVELGLPDGERVPDGPSIGRRLGIAGQDEGRRGRSPKRPIVDVTPADDPGKGGRNDGVPRIEKDPTYASGARTPSREATLCEESVGVLPADLAETRQTQ
jgi:hypothetical protein